MFPRLWASLLALIASGTAVWSVIDASTIPRGRPLNHALAVASILSVVVLGLRLLKVYPHQRLIHYVTLLGLGVVLTIEFPILLTLNAWSIRDERLRLVATVRLLNNSAQELTNVASYDWQSPGAAANAAAVLGALSIERWAPDRYGWEALDLMGRRDGAGEAPSLDGFVEARVALINALTLAFSTRPQVTDSESPYYREIGRLYRELKNMPDPPPTSVRFDFDRRSAVQDFCDQIRSLGKSGDRLVKVLDPESKTCNDG